MNSEGIRTSDELDKATQREVRITPTSRTSLLAWESNSAPGHLLRLLRTLVGLRAAFAKIRIDSDWAGQPLRFPFGQIRREPDERNQVRAMTRQTQGG